MVTTVKETINNQNGFVLVVAMLMLGIVTVIGVGASMTADIELRIASNERQSVNDFYNAEGALIDMLETPSTWLTLAFLTADPVTEPSTASFTGNVDIDSDGTDDGTVEIRHIEETGTPVPGFTDGANDVPVQPHIGPPPVGSGYGLKHFEVHRYGVTATSATGSPQIQAGAWKVFNKSE